MNPASTPRSSSTSIATTAAIALVVLLWASAFVGVKYALEQIPPGPLASARYVIASVAFLLIAGCRRPRLPAATDLARMALAGAIGIALYNLTLNMGQETVGAGVASLIVNTVPIFTALLSVAVLHERISRSGWLGTAISFSGVAIIGLHKSGWAGFDRGVLLILAAAISQASYFVLIQPLLKRYHPIEVTSFTVWFGCIFLSPFSIELPQLITTCDRTTILAVAFLGLGPAALAYLAWSYVLAHMPAGRATNALYLVPVVALALGALLLSEVPSMVSILGGALAVFGVMVGRGLFNPSSEPNTNSAQSESRP